MVLLGPPRLEIRPGGDQLRPLLAEAHRAHPRGSADGPAQQRVRGKQRAVGAHGQKAEPRPQCHLVKQMAEEEYLREKMIYRKESHLLFFAVRQKDRWTSASK